MLETIGLFILISGFVIGLGSVTVIDCLGFLGRKSNYWTEATARAHKVTKPLIWVGLTLVIIGGFIFYRDIGLVWNTIYHLITLPIMLGVGYFLSFKVSPFLLQRESEGKSSEILPNKWQIGITIAFIFSFITWWSNLLVLILYLSMLS
jgi:hypothetical protein